MVSVKELFDSALIWRGRHKGVFCVFVGLLRLTSFTFLGLIYSPKRFDFGGSLRHLPPFQKINNLFFSEKLLNGA
jgi:hypothetical protein